MKSAKVVVTVISLSVQAAYGFAPQARPVVGHQLAPRSAVVARRNTADVARRNSAAVFASAASMSAPASPSGYLAPARRIAARVAAVLLTTLATILLTACRALAATKTKAVVAAPFVITGKHYLYGVGGLVALKWFFSDGSDASNKPAFTFDAVSEPETDSVPPSAVNGGSSLDTSDSAMFGALNARMASLDEDRKRKEEDVRESKNEGGALLDRPTSGPPAVDFPVGFPLRDFESNDAVADSAAASAGGEDAPASTTDEELAMLKRMFTGGE